MDSAMCPSGKKGFDKKGAISFKNLTMKLHHMKMGVYECRECGRWHLTTVSKNKKKRFRHIDMGLDHKKFRFAKYSSRTA